MPKPPLKEEYEVIETELIQSMLAGLHEWRPDLQYPESHSDMAACARGAIKMFEITRRPLGLSNVEIVKERMKCALHGCAKDAFVTIANADGERMVGFCGNDHAREWAQKVILDRMMPSV